MKEQVPGGGNLTGNYFFFVTAGNCTGPGTEQVMDGADRLNLPFSFSVVSSGTTLDFISAPRIISSSEA